MRRLAFTGCLALLALGLLTVPSAALADGRWTTTPPRDATSLLDRFAIDSTDGRWTSMVAGDVDGDGRDDVLAGPGQYSGDWSRYWVVPSRRPFGDALELGSTRGGLHIMSSRRTMRGWPKPAGDIDGDGRGDFVLMTRSGALVVFGRASGTFDLDAPEAEAMRLDLGYRVRHLPGRRPERRRTRRPRLPPVP